MHTTHQNQFFILALSKRGKYEISIRRGVFRMAVDELFVARLRRRRALEV